MLIPGADRFCPDLTLGPPRRADEPEPLPPARLTMALQAARGDFQRGLLKWLKGDATGVTAMRDALARIESTQIESGARAPWWVSLAFLDAVSLGGIEIDYAVKRLGARIDAHIRHLAEGTGSADPDLMRELLFHVAISRESNSNIEMVRSVYRLDDLLPARARQVQTLREQVAAAAGHWQRFSDGLAVALPPFHEAMAHIAAEVEALGQTDLRRLAAALHNFANLLRRHPLAHDETMAIEVANALSLLASSTRYDAQPDVDFAHQVDLVCGRLATLMRGKPLDASATQAAKGERC